ncbi:hypothetical protein GCM10022222_01560 [Amycolatopsis ultiminotia]|uniref:Uncharacterized protein n=1 Tax=Amycolatopsis ultiminotia TaxID=543629 RepID=A0ABP6UY75_9PSEU
MSADDERPYPGETQSEFIARLREMAKRVESAWGGKPEAEALRARADRIERGIEPMPEPRDTRA